MNHLSSDYFLGLYRTNVTVCFSLASEALETARKLTDLNLQIARIALAESTAWAREMTSGPAASNSSATAAKTAAPAASDTAETVRQSVRRSVRSVLAAAEANASMPAAAPVPDVEP